MPEFANIFDEMIEEYRRKNALLDGTPYVSGTTNKSGTPDISGVSPALNGLLQQTLMAQGGPVTSPQPQVGVDNITGVGSIAPVAKNPSRENIPDALSQLSPYLPFLLGYAKK